MSIATELTRIQTAKSNLRQSIINKGGTVASDALLGAYSTAVDNLPSGGDVPENLSAYELDDWGNPESITIKSGVTTLPSRLYENRTTLKSVTISDSVTGIYAYCFKGCNSLSSVTIGTGVTYMDGGVFQSCSAITSVNLPSGLTSIPLYTFQDCINLSSITFSNNITSIGIYAFSNCKKISSFTIPDSVVTLGDAMFRTCDGLSSVVIGTGVKTISPQCFWGCIGLGEINIPDNVMTIKSSAFGACYVLSSLTIGTGITIIEESAFSGDRSLSSITCNAITAPTIGNNAFNGVAATGTLYYPQGSDYSAFIAKLPTGWTTVETRFVENGGAETCIGFNKCKPMKLQDYIGGQWQDHTPAVISYFVTEELSTDCGFDESDYKMYAKKSDGDIALIPVDGNSELTSGNTSDYNRTYFNSARIYSGVTSIGYNAFLGCESLTSITIPSGVTSIGQSAFGRCGSLPNILLPDSLTYIGQQAFWRCSGLTSIIIPSSVTGMGNNVFENCTKLSSVTINNGVTVIGAGFLSGAPISEIIISDSVTQIGVNAFRQCISLTSATIGAGITSFGTNIFYNSNSLSSITSYLSTPPIIAVNTFSITCPTGTLYVPQGSDYSNWIANFPTGWTVSYLSPEQTSKAKLTLTGGTEVYLPRNGSSDLGWADVSGYQQSISSIEIYSAVTGSISLGGCSNLTAVTFPSTVTSLPSEAFSMCTALEDITIPDTITTIGDSAFYYCTSLSSITFGSGLTYIDSWAFMDCSNLTDIYISATTAPTVTNQTFKDIATNGTLHYPEGSDYSQWLSNNEYYLGYYGWTMPEPPKKSTLILNDYTEIDIPANGSALTSGETAQYSANTISAIVYSDASEIGNGAFKDFRNLTGVTIESGITNIRDYAFSSCSGLTSIDIPNTVGSIGGYAFYNCKGLTDITIPDSVHGIGQSAFRYCSGITDITIGSGLTGVGTMAFRACSSLTSITIDAVTAPSISADTFQDIPTGGTLTYPSGSDYSTWLSNNQYYLGYYNWTGPVSAQYRWVDYEAYQGNISLTVYGLNGNDGLYNLEKQQVSTDGGTTWSDVSPLNTRFDAPIENPYPINDTYVAGNFYSFYTVSEECQTEEMQYCDDEGYNMCIEGCGGDPECETSCNYEDYCYTYDNANGYIDRTFNVYTSTNNGSSWTSSQSSETQEDRCFCLGECGEPEEPVDPEPSE